MTPDQYCQDKTAKSGSSFYYSFLFLPPDKRRAITALYAYCREADDAVDECTDLAIAQSKLDWWRQEVDKLYAGNPSHPVTQALAACLNDFKLQKEHLLAILDGMQMDLEYNRYETFEDLRLYCHRVAGVVGLLATEIFGYTKQQTLEFAENLGLAFQLTNIIRDIKEDALRDRIYLPNEDLERFGVKPAELTSTQSSAALKSLVKFEIERAQEFYLKAYSALPESDRYNQRSSMVMSAIYKTILDEIKSDDYKVLEYRIKLTPIRKLWIAWKTIRQEKKRFKHA